MKKNSIRYITISNISRRQFSVAELILGIVTFILILIGYLLAKTINLFFLFYISCIFVVIIGNIYSVKQIIQGKINFGSIISLQTAVWYALPFTYVGFWGYEEYISDVGQIDNAISCVIVVILCSIQFLFFQNFTKPVNLHYATQSLHTPLYLMIPLSALQIILLLNGERTYASSIGLGETGNGSLIYQFLSSLLPALMPLCAIYIAKIMNSQNIKLKYIIIITYIFIIILQILWFYTAGRRPMAILVMLSIISFMAIRFSGPMNLKKILKMLVLLALSAQAVWFLWNSYFALRVVYDQAEGTESVGVMNVGQSVLTARTSDAEEQFRVNTISRPFATVSSLTSIRNDASGYLWGWNAFSQVLQTIPSAIFPKKFEFIGPVFEDLYYQELGVPLIDHTNTILLEGYVDFGFFGFFFYTIIIHFFLKYIFQIKTISKNVNIYNFAYFVILFQLLNIETTINTILVCFLSILLFVFIFIILKIVIGSAVLDSPRKN